MKKSIIAIILTIVILSACKSAKEKAREQIIKAEKTLVDAKTKQINPQTAAMLVQAYVDYVSKYETDSICPDYLYKAAEVSDGLGNPRQAVEFYKETYEKYPTWKKAPVAHFMQAFTLDTRLTDYFHAGQVYESFLVKYPDNKLAKDARFMLDNLGKTDEELMKTIQQQGEAKMK